jgi:hypothetical protein
MRTIESKGPVCVVVMVSHRKMFMLPRLADLEKLHFIWGYNTFL